MAKKQLLRQPNGDFAPGNAGGGNTPGRSHRVKDKYLKKWEEVFDSCDPRQKLMDLAERDFPEFVRLGLAAMPKEHRLDANINIFDGRSDVELEHFACTGEWPDLAPVQIEEKKVIEVKAIKVKKGVKK